jgi:hypothetical protein
MSESKDSVWPSYLIDSDVLIDHLRGYQQALDFIIGVPTAFDFGLGGI